VKRHFLWDRKISQEQGIDSIIGNGYASSISGFFLRKRIYELTTKGKIVLDETLNKVDSLQTFIQDLLVM